MGQAGRPLAALPGWGGDEEALSATAWRWDRGPEMIDGDVAHLYRSSAPWRLTTAEAEAIAASRRGLVQALIPDPGLRRELLAWIGQPARKPTEALSRWQSALARAPRMSVEWLAQVVEPAERNGRPVGAGEPVTRPVVRPDRKATPPQGRANYGAREDRRTCGKCGSADSEVVRTVHAGRCIVRYRRCLCCGQPRATRDVESA